jgi:hypothetical protein
MLPPPSFDAHIPRLQIHNAIHFAHSDALEPVDLVAPWIRTAVLAVANRTGADIFDPRRVLCGVECLYQEAGISIYMDSAHIAASRIEIVKEVLLEAVR